MSSITSLECNPFMENTYLVWDSARRTVVIDPGMSNTAERAAFIQLVEQHDLKLERLILTHAHIDHVLGISWLHAQYGLIPELHAAEQIVYDANPQVAMMYGIPLEPLPEETLHLSMTEPWRHGDIQLELRFTPGHSPGSVSFYAADAGWILAGDALFKGSIGRTDLPGGDHDTLLASIRNELLSLSDDTLVYSGHGPATTIGVERQTNPWLI